MKINEYGQVIVNESEAFEALYSGKIKTLENIFIDGDIERYNRSRKINADSIPELEHLKESEFDSKELFDQANQCTWFMPENYCPNLVDDLYSMCTTEEQRNRITEELELFIKHGMFDLLFYLKYLVDTLRDNKILWGVGRGSSVASYVLYLLGVHRIDSLRYQLDIHEFLK